MGPATDKHQAPTHRLKLYVRAVIESYLSLAVFQSRILIYAGSNISRFQVLPLTDIQKSSIAEVEWMWDCSRIMCCTTVRLHSTEREKEFVTEREREFLSSESENYSSYMHIFRP